MLLSNRGSLVEGEWHADWRRQAPGDVWRRRPEALSFELLTPPPLLWRVWGSPSLKSTRKLMDPVFVDRVVALRFQFPDLLFDQVRPKLFVIDYRTVTVGVVPKVTGSRVWGVVLVLLSENVFVDIKLLTAVDHPPDPGDASFEEPKELVEVVSWNIQRSGRDENGVVVTSLKGGDWSTIFAGGDRKVRV